MARHPSAPAGPGRRRAGRWRATLGHSLPVVGVSLVMLLVAVIAYHVYVANRHGATALSNDLVTAIEQRIVVQMRAYLEPAQRLLELADTAVDGRPVFEARREAERYARHALVAVPSVSALSYADADGNYLFVLRNDKGSFDSKLVDLRGGGRRVTWIRRDAAGAVISTADDPTDTFDARERPWFKAAAEARRPVWTDTYQFFTIRKPGLTFAIPRFDDAGRLLTVMALDIELASLSTFLSQLAIGVTGKAYIIDRTGRIVAFPSANWSVPGGEGGHAPLLDELHDPTLTRAYNRLRVEGYGRKVLDFGDRRVIVSSEPVSMLTGRDWVALIIVPETDFVGFVANSGLFALAMSTLVVVIVMSLAGLLTWRNVIAGRRVAAATTRQQALEGRTRAFVDLARTIAAENEAEGVAQTSESAATACTAKRVAIWRLSADRRTLTCDDCYDATARDHTSGLTLHRDELPNLFAALDNGGVIDTIDARRDRRTAELHAAYLEPLAIDNVYLSPLLYNGRAIGLLSVEDPQRGDRAAGLAAFCETLSILLALRFSAAAPTQARPDHTRPAPPPAEAATSAHETRQARLERVLIHHDLSLKALGAGALDGAAVGVLKLPDWKTVAQRPPEGGGRTAMETIVQEVRTAIERSGVSYAALLDDQIIVAALPADDMAPGRGAALVAMAMLELRDCLTRLEEKWGTSLDFRLAIDVGTVMTSSVDNDPDRRNLWGGAVGVAKVLAETTARHTIASSETAYELLSGQFLFRARGSYFLPETGTMRTFVMVGRT